MWSLAAEPVASFEHSLTSRQTCAIVGVSYRQLDYAARTIRQLRDLAHGSGSRRRWPVSLVRRLQVAAQLDAATASNQYAGSRWIAAARACVAGPEPPESGFAILSPHDQVGYYQTINAADLPSKAIGTLIRYELDTETLVAELAA